MENAQEALILVYAVFWSTALAGTDKYFAFDTARCFGAAKEACAVRRFLVSMVVLNISPVAWLYLLTISISARTDCPLAVALSTLAALSVFGFHRILYALIAAPSTYRHFYSKNQYKKLKGESPFEQVQSFWAHFVPGLLYLVLPPLPAWLML